MSEPALPNSTTPEHPSGWYRVWLPRTALVTLVAVSVVYGSVWVFGSTSGFYQDQFGYAGTVPLGNTRAEP